MIDTGTVFKKGDKILMADGIYIVSTMANTGTYYNPVWRFNCINIQTGNLISVSRETVVRDENMWLLTIEDNHTLDILVLQFKVDRGLTREKRMEIFWNGTGVESVVRENYLL